MSGPGDAAPNAEGAAVLDDILRQMQQQQGESLDQFAARVSAPPLNPVLWELIGALGVQYARTLECLARLRRAEGPR